MASPLVATVCDECFAEIHVVNRDAFAFNCSLHAVRPHSLLGAGYSYLISELKLWYRCSLMHAHLQARIDAHAAKLPDAPT